MSSDDACAELTGSYANLGERAGSTSARKPELRYLLFDDAKDLDEAQRIDLDFSADRRLRVQVSGPGGPLAEVSFSETEDTLSCGKEGAEIRAYSGVTNTPGNPIVGYEHSSTLLIRAKDGSLVVKSASGGFGLVYLIVPAGISGHNWYRFPGKE